MRRRWNDWFRWLTPRCAAWRGITCGRNVPITCCPFSFFPPHIALGQNDQALERLEEAVQSHLSGMIFIRVNPELDPIRSAPRFKELVRRMGLSD